MKDIVFSLTGKINNQNFKFGSLKNNKDRSVLIIVCSADRGLCGGFNGSIIKFVKKFSENLSKEGKKSKFIFVGKKLFNL